MAAPSPKIADESQPGAGVTGARIVAWRIAEKLGALLILAAILLVMTIFYPDFVTTSNLLTIGLQATTRAILAIGVTLVIVSGGIDLSVGTVMSLSMVTMATFMINLGQPMWVGIPIAVAVGGFAGLINGFLVTIGGLPPFIATLGMLGIAQGTALSLSKGYSMYGFPESFQFIGGGTLFGIPFPLYILVAVALLMGFVFRHTKVGRYAFAIGGNEEGVRRTGVSIGRYKLSFYIICGALSGTASIVLASRINSAHPGVGYGYELDAIAASVIGGASLMGGRGSVSGAIIGAFIMATIRFGLNVLGMSPFLQQIAVGAILIGAVFLDNLRLKHEARVSKARFHR
jgi:ribose transport system permease protein